MEKVAGSNYYSVTPFVSASTGAQPSAQVSSLERNPMVRGHHSGVHKAVEAHRMMVEERVTRNNRRERGVTPFESQPTNDFVLAHKAAEEASGMGNDPSADDFENSLIEPIESQAKAATVQAFQAQEPDRPFVGEPIPKGSYIDVQA